MKGETEGFIIAAQDHDTDPKCRICNSFVESVDHIYVASGCPVLAKKEYMERHDKAASYIH
jgi:hypothetical protein